MIKDFEQYARYVGYDPHISKKLPKYMRSSDRCISKLLENIDFTSYHGIDYHISKARPLNKPRYLVELLKNYDTCIYLSEAEAKTIPTKKFISDFAGFCSKTLPDELNRVAFNQLYRDNDGNVVICNPPIITDEDQDISPMICLALPAYTDEKSQANKLISKFIEIAVNDGYFLAYKPTTVDCKYHDDVSKDVSIIYMTFEAKYTSLNVDLAGNLFHVTTEKALKDIVKHGLVPKSESTEFSYPPRIFLFNKSEYDEILAYGKNKAEQNGFQCFYVLKIDKSSIENYPKFKSNDFMLYRDPSFSHDDSKTDETAIFTYDKIPVSLLNENVAKYNIHEMKPIMMKLKDFE